MRRLLNLKQPKQSREPTRQRPHRAPPRPQEPSPITELPYEIVENILIFAWHGDTTGLPGSGSFLFDTPRAASSNDTDTTTELLPNPHTRLTSSNDASRSSAGRFPSEEEYKRLSLVCSQWHEIMQDVVKMFVPLTSLWSFRAYSQIVGIEVPSSSGSSSESEEQSEGTPKKKTKGGSSKRKEILDPKEVENKARRLCQSVHIDIPTGNLSMVPSWSSILPILQRLHNLSHLMLTVAEPHPALFDLLGSLPHTITTLDIHISSPYVYKRPTLPTQMSIAPMSSSGATKLRDGVSGVRHLLVNVLDPLLLECLLEGFGSCVDNIHSGSGSKQANSSTTRGSKIIYSSPSLQTLIIQGPHDLTSSHITNTVSHSHTIHTLKLYPHISCSNSSPSFSPSYSRLDNSISGDPLRMWNVDQALANEAWFPALEVLIVQLPLFEESTPALDETRRVCKERGVRVSVEWVR